MCLSCSLSIATSMDLVQHTFVIAMFQIFKAQHLTYQLPLKSSLFDYSFKVSQKPHWKFCHLRFKFCIHIHWQCLCLVGRKISSQALHPPLTKSIHCNGISCRYIIVWFRLFCAREQLSIYDLILWAAEHLLEGDECLCSGQHVDGYLKAAK